MNESVSQEGICPHCGGRGDSFFTPCPEKACQVHGYNLIPVEYFPKKGLPQGLDPRIGLVLDRYLLVKKLGAGGMGAVYLALQKPLMREVALKLLTQVNVNKEVEERFFREAKAMSLLGHPNVIRLHDFALIDIQGQPTPIMVMEYLKGGITLREWFQDKRNQGQKITIEDVDILFSQVLTGLYAAHKQGLIHRDIKPENIMVVPIEGNPLHVKILDFGLAKALENIEGFNTDLSHTGSFLGTPYYMAPEQTMFASKDARVSPASDLYAVGVMLFETFAGVRPFTGANYREIIWNKVNPDFDPFAIPEAEKWPPVLKKFLKKAMAINQDERFNDALDMLDALEDVLTELDTSTAPVGLSVGKGLGSSRIKTRVRQGTTPTVRREKHEDSSIEETDTPRRTSKGPFIVIGILLAALAGGVLFWLSGTGRKERKTPATASSTAMASSNVVIPRLRAMATDLWQSKRRPMVVVFETRAGRPRKVVIRRKKAVTEKVTSHESGTLQPRSRGQVTKHRATPNLWKALDEPAQKKPARKGNIPWL